MPLLEDEEDLGEELAYSVQDITIAITTGIKTRRAASKLQEKSKLIDFFKCLHPECEFSTNEDYAFVSHHVAHEDENYLCFYCLSSHSTIQSLVGHMTSHHGRRRFQCSSCFYRAISHTHVQTHISNSHQDSFVLSCPNNFPVPPLEAFDPSRNYSDLISPYECIHKGCSYSAFSTELFLQHMQVTHAGQFVCHLCEADFSQPEILVQHHLVHSVGRYQCPHCTFGAQGKEQVLSHQSLYHPDLPLLVFDRNFVLLKTALASAMPSPPKEEEEEEEDIVEEAKESDDGNESDSTPDNVMSMLLNPQMTIEVDDAKKYEINEESAGGDAAGGAQSNMAAPSNPVMNNYLRYIDRLAAQSPLDSLSHNDAAALLNAQNSLNELQCNVCQSTTKDFNSMKRHLGSQHNITMMFNCVYCQEPGLTQDKIKIHIKKKHPRHLIKIGKMYSPKLYYFRCPFCRFATDKKANFKGHVCTELGEVCFVCALCRNGFSQRAKALAHVREKHAGSQNPEAEVLSDKEGLKNKVEAILPILSKKLFQGDEGDITVFSALHFTCPECSEKFRLPLELAEHLKADHIHFLSNNFLNEDPEAFAAAEDKMEAVREKVFGWIVEQIDAQKHELIEKLAKVHNISLFTDNKPSVKAPAAPAAPKPKPLVYVPKPLPPPSPVKSLEKSPEKYYPRREGLRSFVKEEVIDLSDDEPKVEAIIPVIAKAKHSARKSMPNSSRPANLVLCGHCGREFLHMFAAKRHHQAFHIGKDAALTRAGEKEAPTRAEEEESEKEEEPPSPVEEEAEGQSHYGQPLELVSSQNLVVRRMNGELESDVHAFMEGFPRNMQPAVVVKNFLCF